MNLLESELTARSVNISLLFVLTVCITKCVFHAAISIIPFVYNFICCKRCYTHVFSQQYTHTSHSFWAIISALSYRVLKFTCCLVHILSTHMLWTKQQQTVHRKDAATYDAHDLSTCIPR